MLISEIHRYSIFSFSFPDLLTKSYRKRYKHSNKFSLFCILRTAKSKSCHFFDLKTIIIKNKRSLLSITILRFCKGSIRVHIYSIYDTLFVYFILSSSSYLDFRNFSLTVSPRSAHHYSTVRHQL